MLIFFIMRVILLIINELCFFLYIPTALPISAISMAFTQFLISRGGLYFIHRIGIFQISAVLKQKCLFSQKYSTAQILTLTIRNIS